ncbi:MAG: DNA pilot protein [Microviridae sp.]|nr:MAG: DNA pilot protein [Microviridae sp.]
MPFDLGGIGMQAASTAINTGFGLLLEGHNDRRQIKQQQKLQDMQIAGNKQMIDYNKEKELQMWKDTNYKAQVDELTKAGLNPALLYGKGGGGGTTVGSAGMGVSGGNAPQGGREIMDAMGMGIQMQLLKAQKENIEADTELKRVDAVKKEGIDTELAKGQVESLQAGVNSERTKKAILDWEEKIKAIDYNIANQTSGERMGAVVAMAGSAAEAYEIIQRDNEIGEETRQAKIEQLKAESVGAAIKNTLAGAQISLTQAQITKIGSDIAIGWQQLTNEQQKVRLQTALTNAQVKQIDFNTSDGQRWFDNAMKAVNTVVGAFKPVGGTTIESQTKNIILPPSN